MLGIDFLPCLHFKASVYIWPSILLLPLVPWQYPYLSKERLSIQHSVTACILSVSSLSLFKGKSPFPTN